MEVSAEFDDMDVSEQIVVDDADAVVNKPNESPSKSSTAKLTSDKTSEKTEKLTKLPLTRIKHLIKLDPDVSLASQDAVFVLSKATELFITMLGKEAYKFTKQNKKKTIQRKDIDDCISSCESLAFLEGTIKDDI